MPQGEVGIAYPSTAFTATGGKPPYSWSLSGAPAWLTLSGNSASGTPDVPGTTSFTVQATDAAGQVATSPRSVDIQPALVVRGSCEVAPCSVEAGCDTVCGNFGSQSGGVAPYSYKLLDVLPPGMGLSGLNVTGVFPGTSFKFSVIVADAVGANVSIAAYFNVFAHIAMKAGPLPTGQVRIAYTARIPYSGGSGVPSVKVVKGALPPGLGVAVDPKNLVVVISGTPTANGSFPFVLQLTDASPCGPGYNCNDVSPTLTITIG